MSNVGRITNASTKWAREFNDWLRNPEFRRLLRELVDAKLNDRAIQRLFKANGDFERFVAKLTYSFQGFYRVDVEEALDDTLELVHQLRLLRIGDSAVAGFEHYLSTLTFSFQATLAEVQFVLKHITEIRSVQEEIWGRVVDAMTHAGKRIEIKAFNWHMPSYQDAALVRKYIERPVKQMIAFAKDNADVEIRFADLNNPKAAMFMSELRQALQREGFSLDQIKKMIIDLDAPLTN